MKKAVSLILALAMAVPVIGVAACGNGDEGGNTNISASSGDALRLNSDPVQNLRVGDEDKIIYDAKADGKVVTNAVDFVSSDDSVITVDQFGNVSAVGVGTATVTLTLKNNAAYTAKVKYNVTKTFFMTRTGYLNGDVDLSTAELDGWVRIPSGSEIQVLVSECAEDWYFKTTIEHSGDTGQNSVGRWGIGSFLVDEANPIGNTMMWLGFKPTDHTIKSYTPYVGGWRVMSGGNDQEIEIGDVMENANIAEMEIIRHGIDHYCTVTVGNQVAKYTYSCPSLAGKATFPGVYSQRQELYVSDYSVSVDPEVVMDKLNNFQLAEEVAIEGVSDKLFAGNTYNLKATVAPETTYNKNVTFSLKEPVEGVTITPAGTLTIGDSVTGTVTVVAMAESGDNVFIEKTYNVSVKGASAHELFDTDTIVVEDESDVHYTLGEGESANSVTYQGVGKSYIPFVTEASSKWAVKLSSDLSSGTIGIYSMANGMTNYVATEISANKLVYGLMNAEDSIACNTAAQNEVILIRDGSFYYIVVNGRLVDRFYAPLGVDSVPAIYTDSAYGTVGNVELITDSEEIDELIALYPYTVGKYVTVNSDGSYTLAAMEFAGEGDINWPPVNNYENGLKFSQTLKGDFTIEFDMIDARPLAKGGKIDSKILIYLRSETKTASLQFVLKSEDANPANVVCKFCPNLNDATWTEYETSLDFMRQSNGGANQLVHIKIVKTADVVEFYVEESCIRFFEGNPGLNNVGFWDENTEFTPGIGTYMCGVTLSNVKLTAGRVPNPAPVTPVEPDPDTPVEPAPETPENNG